MSWTKEEIEARMMDALDGTLSNEDLQQLKTCLLAFPELGNIDESYPTLSDDDVEPFSKKSLLKKIPFNPSVYSDEEGTELEKMTIAQLEGLLNEKEALDFNQALKVEPLLQKEWHLVNQTKLQANLEQQFPNPEFLLKEIRMVNWRKYVSYSIAAASLLLFIFLGWPSQTPKDQASHKPTLKNTTAKQSTPTNHTTSIPVLEVNKQQEKPGLIEHIEPVVVPGRDCVIPFEYPEEPAVLANNELVIPTPNASVAPSSSLFTSPKGVENVPAQEVMGLKEFVVQKGNERLFGSSNPSVSDRYTSIANYLSKTTNLPIDYVQSTNEKEEITYVRLGFISIERKRTKK